ncbi:hypothetical protein J4E06_08670 [Muricauda sp. NFXS6]|uniref:hypothetical protein n=1 Tax=Flavobacteriaceae TaxID=49546 RepID=UPI0032DFF171
MKKLLFSLLISTILLSCSNDDNNEITLPEELNFNGEVLSCADFSVKQFLEPENFEISLNIHGQGREELELSSEYKTFSLPNNDLYSTITIFDASIRSSFCNDVVIDDGPNLISSWNAISGTIKLSVSDIEITEFETFYSLDILLEDVIFEKANSNEQRKISRLTIENAGLGFFPG